MLQVLHDLYVHACAWIIAFLVILATSFILIVAFKVTLRVCQFAWGLL